VHFKTHFIMASKYSFKERRWVDEDTRVMEVDRVMGSIYLTDRGVDKYHLISFSSYSYNQNTHFIFPNSESHSLCPRCCGSMQWHGSSTPDSIISSHPISILLKPEPLFLINSFWMLHVHVQVLRRLCSSTIHRQIDRIYIYRLR
jgi:hypothetical protein